MNLPCSVIRDLLPLYAEGLAGRESAALVQEHVAACASCRDYLAGLQKPAARTPDSAAPMQQLKKELKKRRLRTAAIAALSVFVLLFALLAHATQAEPLPYSPGLLRVAGVIPYDPAAETPSFPGYSGFLPEGWQPANPGKALLVERSDRVSGVETQFDLDEESGELTVYLQYYDTRARLLSRNEEEAFSEASLESHGAQDVFYPAPDRVIYGFGGEQVLLWGQPMNGGMQILPRLALAYYGLMAAVLLAILAVLWLICRKKRRGPVILQLCFLPLAYLLGQLFVKGGETVSFFLPRDLGLICLEAAAFYGLLTLGRQAWRQHRQDKACP
ncbi:MAG: zf-HC2 domain-containing protein [Firmicutes bacterium]|nr:zf-HC2 domain-containing protein [Bacillota bacterium]